MPYIWTETADTKTLTLWPHQSMTPDGFAWFIGTTGLLLTLPIFAVLGSPVAWVLMIFFFAALWATWRAIMLNRKHRSVREILTIGADQIHLQHVPPSGPSLEWDANPYWVKVRIRKNGPVDNYLTMSGNNREVELGAFLSPEERAHLYAELNHHLSRD